jgi:hypothetical protein
MAALFAALFALGGLGGLGFWWVRRNQGGGTAPPPQLPPPQEPLGLPAPADIVPDVAPQPPRAQPVLNTPSDFVERLRRWLERRPPAEQVELMASHLEQAGHPETAQQLRAWARERRSSSQVRAAPDPMDPTSRPSAPAGSSELPLDPGSGELQNNGAGNVAQPVGSQGADGALRRLARRVATMLQAREGQATDRNLVRRFQRAARLFPDRPEPSGLYGPVTRDALVRYGIRRPPEPPYRADLESGPRRAAARPNAPPPQENDPNRPRSAT